MFVYSAYVFISYWLLQCDHRLFSEQTFCHNRNIIFFQCKLSYMSTIFVYKGSISFILVLYFLCGKKAVASRRFAFLSRKIQHTRKNDRLKNNKKRKRCRRTAVHEAVGQMKTKKDVWRQRRHHICYQKCSWTADWRPNDTVQQPWDQSVSITSIHYRTRTHTSSLHPSPPFENKWQRCSPDEWAACGCYFSPTRHSKHVTWHSAADGWL